MQENLAQGWKLRESDKNGNRALHQRWPSNSGFFPRTGDRGEKQKQPRSSFNFHQHLLRITGKRRRHKTSLVFTQMGFSAIRELQVGTALENSSEENVGN